MQAYRDQEQDVQHIINSTPDVEYEVTAAGLLATVQTSIDLPSSKSITNSLSPLVFSALVIVALLHLKHRLSEAGCRLLLLIFILLLSLPGTTFDSPTLKAQASETPLTMPTVRNRLGLEINYRRLLSCPECFKTYGPESFKFPKTEDTNLPPCRVPESPNHKKRRPCVTLLFTTIEKHGVVRFIPRKVVVYAVSSSHLSQLVIN